MTARLAWIVLALGLQLALVWQNGPERLWENPAIPQTSLVFGTIRHITADSFSLCIQNCVRVFQPIPEAWQGRRAWAEGVREKNFLLPKSKNAVDVLG